MNLHCHFKAEIHHCHRLPEICRVVTTRHKHNIFISLPACRYQALPFLHESKENKSVSAFPTTYINISFKK